MESLMMDELLNCPGRFIFLNFPSGMEFGIDLKCWEVGSNFRGVKMIPPGTHYLYYSDSTNPDHAVHRRGFLHEFKKNEIFVKKWDVKTKDISTKDVSDDEMEQLVVNLQNVDNYLGSYPIELWDKWKSLSNHITENLINRLMPKCGFVRVYVDSVVSPNKSNKRKRWTKARTDIERQEDLLPNLVPVEGTEIRFTEFPEERYPIGSTPSEITAHYLDATYTLTKMLSSFENPLEFVGEIQFAFVATLIGLNIDAFEQWKYLVQLVCSCEKAIMRQILFYSEFITCLSAQLEEIPIDFLVDIVANDNIIYTSLRDFFRTIQTTKGNVEPRLMSKILRFRNDLTDKFEWEFNNLEEEMEDEAPVIVDDATA